MSGAYALTIESQDMGYIPGHTYNYTEGPFQSTGLDLSEGTGKRWDFATFTGSWYYNYTKIYSVSNVAKFPSATIAIDYAGMTLAAFSGTQYYREQNGDLQYLGEIAGTSTNVYSPFISMGLPHSVGKTWSSSYTYNGTAQSQDGKVIADGTITTKLGSFPAILVKYQTGSTPTYNFETKEYGRIAYFALNNLMVLTSGTKNTGIRIRPRAGASERNFFSCSGEPGAISIRSELAGQVRMYSADGGLVRFAEINAGIPWQTHTASGAYVIDFASPQYSISRSVTVGK
ncbi:MAG: hypothetical protein JF616_04635 [Fibrobacteres bacterium]|jgi:hypothetical protein|nr:hypothetical protein [Fibrobacterota bacterium]